MTTHVIGQGNRFMQAGSGEHARHPFECMQSQVQGWTIGVSLQQLGQLLGGPRQVRLEGLNQGQEIFSLQGVIGQTVQIK